MTTLQEIVAANASFLSGSARLLNSSGERFVVLACIEGKLNGLLEPALGLPPTRAEIVRVAGNRVREDCRDALRSLATAFYLKGANEIFVVGHTGCCLAGFAAPDVIESFRRQGIARSAFGNEDLRTWFGAFHDARENVVEAIEFIRKSGLFPNQIRLHGLILETDSGRMEVVYNGDEMADTLPPPEPPAEKISPPPAEPVPAETSGGERPPIPHIPAKPKPVQIPSKGSKSRPAPDRGTKTAQPASLSEATTILRDSFLEERNNPKLQRSISELKTALRGEKNPFVALYHLERLVKEYQDRHPKMPQALEIIRKSLHSKESRTTNLVEQIRRFLE